MAKYDTQSLFGDDPAEKICSGQVVTIAFDSGADMVFSYILPEALGSVEPGQRLEVPFGRKNKPSVGFCVGIETDHKDQASEVVSKRGKKFALKPVKRIVDSKPLLNAELMELARWISEYYVCPLGQVLAAMVPAAVKKGAGVKKETYAYLNEQSREPKLTSKKQKRIVEFLQEQSAVDEENAVAKADILEACECTATVLKRLSRDGIVRLIQRAVIKTLPAIPAEFSIAEGDFVLNDDQVRVLADIGERVQNDRFGVTLLHGVTDSGKTEIYILTIQETIKAGKSAIVLLPEIALTTQTVNRFTRRFERVAVMHSGLTAVQRNAQWQKIKTGEADVVIGARSAVFAPLSNLGLIVVDEEHEPSYKQDTAPRYNGRDVAIKRSHLAGAHCILGSATPSLESLVNCRTKEHYTLAELPKRVRDLPAPAIKLVDMTQPGQQGSSGLNLMSEQLLGKLKNILQRNEQAILLLNRRGYSNFVFCPSCRHTLNCKNCDVTLTFHKRRGVSAPDSVLGGHIAGGFAVCHYCLSKTLVPARCPLCSAKMTMIGIGSQRLEEELAIRLPRARVVRVDSDSMHADARKYHRVLADFAAGNIDILAGTQMLAKGLHFPNVTLVGVISADTALYLPDFRANERTFQLLCQVAGRAGRSEKGGVVIIQTFLPDSKAIQFAVRNDYKGFVADELLHRKKWCLPPWHRMAIMRLRHAKFEPLSAACEVMGQRIEAIIADNGLKIRVRGPMPATISRVGGQHRMQIVLQAESVAQMGRLFAVLRAMRPIQPAVTVNVDVDALNLL